MSRDRCLLMQWYTETPAKAPTTNAMILVTAAVISNVVVVLWVVGVTPNEVRYCCALSV